MTVNRIPLRNWSEIEFELAKIRGELDRLGVASEQSSRGWFQQLHVRDRAQFLGVAAGGYLRLDANNYLEQVPAGIGEANTASNVGVGGVGLYNAKVGVDLQFRNINAASARLSVALDAPNNEVDLDVVEAQINHDNLGTRTHDGDTLQLDGVTSNGGAFNFTTSGTLTFSNTVALSTCINAAGDTDKFLVLDGADNVDFRTGAEVLSDIGGAAAVHTHDGDTLQLDGVNSDGGAFSFNTTGAVTFNQDVNTQNLGVTGNITVTGTVDGVDVADHHARHENGGADEIDVGGLSGELADAQPVAVSKNSGAIVGTRSELNFIEGANITLTIADDAGNDEVDITIAAAGGGAHDLLSATHSDTAADAVTRGSLIYGNATPKWDELVVGAANSVLVTDGTDVSWDNTPTIDGLTMAGDIAMGGNSITGVNQVDGVDVSDHHARHENGGADEISVAGLSGVLADAQTPAAHVHDGDTLEHDAVNSNGGDFDFTTTGDIRHIVGVGNAFVLTDVVTDDTDKRPAIRAEQYDSTGEPEGFTVIYVEGKA